MNNCKIIHSRLTKKQLLEINKVLSCKKKRPIGQGSTAKVYSLENTSLKDFVLRRQNAVAEFSIDAYCEWVQVCLNVKSKHIPKVIFHAEELDKQGVVKSCITVLEKLENSPTKISNHRWWSDSIKAIYYCNYLESSYRWWNEQEYKQLCNTRTLKSVFSKIKQTNPNLDLNDMHERNMMIRKKDGKLVITDPCA